MQLKMKKVLVIFSYLFIIGLFYKRHLYLEEETEQFIHKNLSLQERLFPDFKNCTGTDASFYCSQKGNFWILENFIVAEQSFRCDESVTYTTHGEYDYLENLEAVAERWQVSECI